MIKKNIAVVAGGDSSEYGVSVRSGANVLKAINLDLFNPWLVRIRGEEWIVLDGENKLSDIDKADFSFTVNGLKCKFDYAYIIIKKGMANMFHVNPDLVGPTRFQYAFDEIDISQSFNYLVMGDRGFSACAIRENGINLAVSDTPANIPLDGSFIRSQVTPY